MLVYLLKISCGDDMHSQIIILKKFKVTFFKLQDFSCGVALFLFIVHSPKAKNCLLDLVNFLLQLQFKKRRVGSKKNHILVSCL